MLSWIKDGEWFISLLALVFKLSHGQKAEQEELFSFFYTFFAIPVQSFLPFPPTPSLRRSDALNRTLWAPKSAGFLIYRLCVHDYGCSEGSSTHNRISFHQNRSKGCLLPSAHLHTSLFSLVSEKHRLYRRWKSGWKAQDTNKATLGPDDSYMTIKYLLIVLWRQRNNAVALQGFFIM